MAKKNKKNREVKIHVFEIFKADIQSSEKKKESGIHQQLVTIYTRV
jgi:hypothetical protein